MKKHDITNDIRRLHEENIMEALEKEVKIELSERVGNFSLKLNFECCSLVNLGIIEKIYLLKL